MVKKSSSQALLPIWLALAIAAGILIGAQFVAKPIQTKKASSSIEKLREVVLSIDNNYVDSVDVDYLVEEGIKGMLKELDPHTAYISSEEINQAHAQLKGSYDGIGIEFDVINDSITVVKPTDSGPSFEAGIQTGDRIISVNGERVVGINITSKGVTERLLGEKGSEVDLLLYRPLTNQTLPFKIKRGSIYQSTVDAFYMVDNITGYIKLTRFGSSSHKEVVDAINDLKRKGMSQLIFDLQGNPGGYLDAAEKIADEFIKENKVIVSQKGKMGKYDDEFKSTPKGIFETQSVVVLMDEYSASASEIVAGALQDNDRALIVGRRSYGKGLVQMPITLTDGSELRLTIARYYTPSGRSIQKSYTNGNTEYAHDINSRYSHGEFFHADSIHFADSLEFKTASGRTVYGGGGIMPDIFVPLDTIEANEFYNNLITSKVLREFTLLYVTTHEEELLATTLEEYSIKFKWDANQLNLLKNTCIRLGVSFDQTNYELSKRWIQTYCKSEIARLVWGGNAYYQLINPTTNTAFEASLPLFKKVISN